MGNSKSRNKCNNDSTNSRPKEFLNSKAREMNSFKPVVHYEPQINTLTVNNSLRYNGTYETASEKRTQDLFHQFDKSHNLCNDTDNIQSKFTETCVNKEKCENKNQISENKSVTAPCKISTKTEFMTEWFSWKNEFLTYMKSIDQAESNKQKWGIMLLNRMGPIGQEIHRSITFNNNHAEEDIDALLEKFDFYCIFGGRKRGDDEDIDKYVNDLTIMASKYMTNTDEIVKKKILREVDPDKFERKTESLILAYSFPSSIWSLTVKEMTYIWMSYENANFKRSEEIHNFLVKNCSNCGGIHEVNNCRAHGKRCNKCGKENHYWMRCPSQFIANCMYCGEAHFVRECPAYLNKCNRCNKMNHFSWKCPLRKIFNCNYCDLEHLPIRSECSARNTICDICKKRGHVPSKCFKKDLYKNLSII